MALSRKATFFQQVQGNIGSVEQLGNQQQYATAYNNITRVSSFANSFEIEDFPDPNLPQFSYSQLNSSTNKMLIQNAVFVVGSYIQSISGQAFIEIHNTNSRYVKLDDNWRVRIRSYIAHIRTALDKIEIDEKLKTSIVNKLNTFASEIEKDRTSLDSGLAVFEEVTESVARGVKNLNPTIKIIGKCVGGLKSLFVDQEESTPEIPNPETYGLIEDKNSNSDNKKAEG